MSFDLLKQYQSIKKPRKQLITEAIDAGLDGLGDIGGAMIGRGKDSKAKQVKLLAMRDALGGELADLNIESDALLQKQTELDAGGNIDPMQQIMMDAQRQTIDKRKRQLERATSQASEDSSFRNVYKSELPKIGDKVEVLPDVGDVAAYQAEQARVEQERQNLIDENERKAKKDRLDRQELLDADKEKSANEWKAKKFNQRQDTIDTGKAFRAEAQKLREEKARRIPTNYRKDYDKADTNIGLIEQSLQIIHNNKALVDHVNPRVGEIISLSESGSSMDAAQAYGLSKLEGVTGDYDPKNNAAYKQILLAIERVTAPIRSDMFGSALSKGDMVLSERGLPKVGDSYEDLVFKLRTALDFFEKERAETMEQAGAQGYDTAGFGTKSLDTSYLDSPEPQAARSQPITVPLGDLELDQ